MFSLWGRFVFLPTSEQAVVSVMCARQPHNGELCPQNMERSHDLIGMFPIQMQDSGV